MNYVETLTFSVILLMCSYFDIKYNVIPNRVSAAGILCGAVRVLLCGAAQAFSPPGSEAFCSALRLPDPADILIGWIGVPLLMLLVTVGYEKISKKRGIGGADIKMMFISGLYLGSGSVYVLFLSCAAAIAALAFSRRGKIPWAPLIALSAAAASAAGMFFL